MPKAKYQFEDFLATVPRDHQAFVTMVHEKLLKSGYRPRITITKSTGLQLAYHQKGIKTTAGIILIFFKRNETLMLRLYGKNHSYYNDVLQELPQSLINQINAANDCLKFKDPTRCFKGCIGNDVDIRGVRYQKCMVNCFEFEVDELGIPYFLKMIEGESKTRFWDGI